MEKQATETVVTHTTSHPLVVEEEETEKVVVELLLEEEDEPQELVLVVEKEAREDVVLNVGKGVGRDRGIDLRTYAAETQENLGFFLA